MCATIAFGMGINASGCRFVIHSTMSKGLDSYWQEAGRAGRDGSLAACTVFARGADLTRLSSMVAEVPHAVSRQEQLRRLYAAFLFALQPAKECRRTCLLRWFGQDPTEAAARCKANGRCDVCDPVIAADAADEGCAMDVSDHLRCLLQLVQRLERRGGAGADKLTLIKLADGWRSGGAAQKSVREGDPTNGEAPLPTAPFSKEDCERVVAVAICTTLLQETFSASSYSYNAYVKLGQKGRDVLQGSAQLEPTDVWLSKAAMSAGEKAAAKAAGGAAKKRKAAAATKSKPKPPPPAAAVGGARSAVQPQQARASLTNWVDDDEVSSGGSDSEWKKEVAKIDHVYQTSGAAAAAAPASSALSGRPMASAAQPGSNGRKRGGSSGTGSKLSKLSRMKLGKAAAAQAANVSRFAEHDRQTREAAAAAAAVSAVATATKWQQQLDVPEPSAVSASHTEVGGGQAAKKRRVPVPVDDDDEEEPQREDPDPAEAEAEFQRDMEQMQAEFEGDGAPDGDEGVD